MKTVVDYCTYYHETCRELLELRIKVLYNHVDKFIICESNKTHSGIPIEYHLKGVIKELGLPPEKFDIIELDIPDDCEPYIEEIDYVHSGPNAHNKNSVLARVRERMQRNAILSVIDKYDDDTFFIVGDCDEIVNPIHIDFLTHQCAQLPNNIIKVPLVYLEGRADLRVVWKDNGVPLAWDKATFVCQKHHLLRGRPINIRGEFFNCPFPVVYVTLNGQVVQDMGWHFSWMGNAKKRKAKREGFCHYQDQYSFIEYKYDSDSAIKEIDDKEAKEGELPPSGEMGTILKKYPITKLPQEIFSCENIREHLLPGTLMDRVFDWGLTLENRGFQERISYEIFDMRVYEKYHRVPKGAIVVDIGASCGPFVFSILDNKPSQIFAFEPHEELFKTLGKNVLRDDIEITLINKAIGPTDEAYDQAGVFDPVARDDYMNHKVSVASISWKTFIETHNITTIDFLKTDCEGGEYDIFNDEHMEWIKKNVKYIVGEWHLETPEQKEKFRHFRETYLKEFQNVRIEDGMEQDIKQHLWNSDFIDYFRNFTVYIDNRPPEVAVIPPSSIKKRYKKDYWKSVPIPVMEVTTTIAKGGCVVDCVFCPQRVLEESTKNYVGDRVLSMDNYLRALEKIPKEVRITFAGFTEPYLNKNCTKMILAAHDAGHPVALFTTGVGMRPEDVDAIKHIKYPGDSNGGLVLHLPDQDRNAKHPINANFIKTIERFKEVSGEIQNFRLMAMGPVHESVRHCFPEASVPMFWNRAGNLTKEEKMKPIRSQIWEQVWHSPIVSEPRTCAAEEGLYHGVMLPNGDVSLCCQDYSLQHIVGNLFTMDYEDVIPAPQSTFKLCESCEMGCTPKKLPLKMLPI